MQLRIDRSNENLIDDATAALGTPDYADGQHALWDLDDRDAAEAFLSLVTTPQDIGPDGCPWQVQTEDARDPSGDDIEDDTYPLVGGAGWLAALDMGDDTRRDLDLTGPGTITIP